MLCHDWKMRRCFVIATVAVLTTMIALWPTSHSAASTDTSRHMKANPSVSSREGWQQMPLSIGKGEKFTVFYVAGTWTVDVRNFPRVGPGGYGSAIDGRIFQPCKLVAGQPFGKLLGRVGESGTAFAVDADGTLTAPDSGTLFLRINDADRCLGDNGGSITVAVAGDDEDVRHPLTRRNFDDYCRDQGFAGGTVATGSDAYSLRCKNSDGSLQEFNNPEDIHNFVGEVCQSAYPDIAVIDRLTTMDGTHDAWECMNRASYAGAPDLRGWCESRGLTLSHRADVRYAAYGWTCVNADRTRSEGISVGLVCKGQFGQDALDRVANVRAEDIGDAWDCRYVR
jgi:hypothetical protein